MSKSVILFRFHDNPEIAVERIKILRFFNPDVDVHALFGGEAADVDSSEQLIRELVSSFWVYSNSVSKEWKWQHTDLVLKHWYRDFGNRISFDFLYSYEYDMLFAEPLERLYPTITQNQIALSACEPFTKEIENRWTWTANEPGRARFLQFNEYLRKNYGIARQKKVCLGPGPLFSRRFLDAWSKTEDIDLVHDELAYPAYGEALGFNCVNTGLHPGFGSPPGERYFSCHKNAKISEGMIEEQLAVKDGVRAFHPVKQMITVDQIKNYMTFTKN